MAGNSFGQIFRITTFGESHGGCLGVVIDGCPPNLEIGEADIQYEVDRRRPGQSSITTPRKEEDRIRILSGVFEGKTTGTPILILAENKDMRPEDYKALGAVYRPSHADYTYETKYGIRDWRGSGRASARETLARVAAGAIAKKYLAEHHGIQIVSYVERIQNIEAKIDPEKVMRDEVEANVVRCPDSEKAAEMLRLIESVKTEGDSLGGVICGVVRNVPPGLGEPVFDKLHADLGKAMLSINAVKGFEIGSGFSGTRLRGSEHNDPFALDEAGRVRTTANRSGGIQGGISNGEAIIFRVAFKPVATIGKTQETVNVSMEPVSLKASGRHDPCVLPRAVPIVDAMAALVLMDHLLRHKAQNL